MNAEIFAPLPRDFGLWNPAMRGAFRKGMEAFAHGRPETACPYQDKRKADGRLTWSRAFAAAWRDGWRHTQHAVEQSPHRAVLLEIAWLVRQGVLSGLRDTYGTPESSLIAGTCLHASYLALTFLRRWHPAFSATPCGGGGGLRGYGALTARGGLLGHYWLEVTDPDGALWILDATSDQFGWDPITLDLASRLTDRYRKEDPALSLAALEEIAAEIEGEQSAVRIPIQTMSESPPKRHGAQTCSLTPSPDCAAAVSPRGNPSGRPGSCGGTG